MKTWLEPLLISAARPLGSSVAGRSSAATCRRDAWARKALTELTGSEVAPRIAQELTAENFRAHTGTIDLLAVLRDRGETGDQALLEALASDPWEHFSGASLGEPLMFRIADLAGEVVAAAKAMRPPDAAPIASP